MNEPSDAVTGAVRLAVYQAAICADSNAGSFGVHRWRGSRSTGSDPVSSHNITFKSELTDISSTDRIADKLGRIRFMQLAAVVVTIGCIIQTASVNIGMFIAGRTITGAAVGYGMVELRGNVCLLTRGLTSLPHQRPERHRTGLSLGDQQPKHSRSDRRSWWCWAQLGHYDRQLVRHWSQKFVQ